MIGQTRRRKGKPKRKGKEKGKEKNPGKGNHNQDQAGPPDEGAGQRRLNDFGKKRQRVEFVGDVQEHDKGFEIPRADRTAYVFCVHSCKNVMSECPEVPSSSVKVISGVEGSEEPAGTRPQERCFLRLDDERPIVDSGSVVSTCPVDHATSVPTEKIKYSMNLESVLGES